MNILERTASSDAYLNFISSAHRHEVLREGVNSPD